MTVMHDHTVAELYRGYTPVIYMGAKSQGLLKVI